MAQPDTISVDDIALAIIGNVLNSPFAKILFDLRSIDAIRLTCEPHYAAQFVER